MQDMLALAELQVGTSLCPDLRPYIVAYLAAHLGTMANRAGNAGAVTAVREGALGITYGNGQPANAAVDPYDTTTYGQQYKQLLKQCIGGIAFRTAVMPWA
jgi:hypothetical protein